jgi:hypothetical protein
LAGSADELPLYTIAKKKPARPRDHRPDKDVPFDRLVG